MMEDTDSRYDLKPHWNIVYNNIILLLPIPIKWNTTVKIKCKLREPNLLGLYFEWMV